jgi:hypothetical protein
MMLIASAAAMIAASVPAVAAQNGTSAPRARDSQASDQQAGDNGGNAGERRVCRDAQLSDSRMRRRICRTAREWQVIDATGEER